MNYEYSLELIPSGLSSMYNIQQIIYHDFSLHIKSLT